MNVYDYDYDDDDYGTLGPKVTTFLMLKVGMDENKEIHAVML